MRYEIRHRTLYRYASPVLRSLGLLRLKPRATPGQRLVSFQLQVSVPQAWWAEHVDAFGNFGSTVEIDRTHDTLELSATACVERLDVLSDAPARASTSLAELAAMMREPGCDQLREAAMFAIDHEDAGVTAAALEVLGLDLHPGRDSTTVAEVSNVIMQRIAARFEYHPGATTVDASLADVLRLGRGVCQDFAHLGIAAARGLGIPARYVSGYLETDPPPGGERLQGVDATHAWFSVFDPVRGWIDLDPTNAQPADLRYVTLAWGRRYADVAPFQGVLQGGGAAQLEVGVSVARLPFSDAPAP